MPTPTSPRHANAPALLHRYQLLVQSLAAPLSFGQRLELRLAALDLAEDLEQAAPQFRGQMAVKLADRARELRGWGERKAVAA